MTKVHAAHRDSATAANPKSGRHPSASRRALGLVAGLVVFLVMLIMDPPGAMPEKAWLAAAVGILMAIWWILEAIPIPATALVPLALFPFLGIQPIKAAAAPYANPLIFLFLVPTAFIMHPFWKESEALAKQNEMAHFMKDIALAGAALFFAYYAGDWWPLSLGG